MNLSGILGLFVAASTIVGAILLGSPDLGGLAFFVNLPSILFVLGVGCGLELMASSARDLGRALWGIRVLAIEPASDSIAPQDGSILRDLAVRIYIAGLGGTLIGLVQLLSTLDDPTLIWGMLAVGLLPFFAAFVLAEVIVRPAAQRICFLNAQQAQKPCGEL